MDSLIEHVTYDQVVKAFDQMRNITIPVVSAYLATEKHLISLAVTDIDEDKLADTITEKEPIFLSRMEHRNLTGINQFKQYAHKVLSAHPNLNAEKENPFEELLDVDEFHHMSDTSKFNQSARLSIIDYISHSATSVDDVFKYVQDHFLGNQRIFVIPKGSLARVIYAEYSRIILANFGQFAKQDSDAVPVATHIYGLNALAAMKYGFDVNKSFIHDLTSSAATMYNPTLVDNGIRKDKHLIKTQDLSYVGTVPNPKQISIMVNLINQPQPVLINQNIKEISSFAKKLKEHIALEVEAFRKHITQEAQKYQYIDKNVILMKKIMNGKQYTSLTPTQVKNFYHDQPANITSNDDFRTLKASSASSNTNNSSSSPSSVASDSESMTSSDDISLSASVESSLENSVSASTSVSNELAKQVSEAKADLSEQSSSDSVPTAPSAVKSKSSNNNGNRESMSAASDYINSLQSSINSKIRYNMSNFATLTGQDGSETVSLKDEEPHFSDVTSDVNKSSKSSSSSSSFKSLI